MTQPIEIPFGNDKHVHRSASLNGRIAALIGQQRHFAEIIATLERREQVLLAILGLQNIALAFLDHIDAIAQIPLLEHHVARFEMLVLNPRFRVQLGLREIGRE